MSTITWMATRNSFIIKVPTAFRASTILPAESPPRLKMLLDDIFVSPDPLAFCIDGWFSKFWAPCGENP